MTTLKPWAGVAEYTGTVNRPDYLSELSIPTLEKSLAFFGQGRSYGDVALSAGKHCIVTQKLNRFISTDWEHGIIRAESGMMLGEILKYAVPRGWFLPVTPGTKFVTLGGAVANDIHGKNHHQTGSFGNFVRTIGLRRSDSEDVLTLSRAENAELFEYTISGLGLTGFIAWVEIELKPVCSSYFDVENIRFSNLNEFFELSKLSEDFPYTVAWVDCFAKGNALGRGIFTRARHSQEDGTLAQLASDSKLTLPINFPSYAMSRMNIKAFNKVYMNRPGATFKGKQHFGKFLYPLDGFLNWNKLYGKRGFYQYQTIVPMENARETISELLKAIEASSLGSFLAVLKIHGDETSPGKNSFPFAGASLALDFPNVNRKIARLFAELDQIVEKCGGRLYPAKDFHMSSSAFKNSYPNWKTLEELRDPAIQTKFWKRVTEQS
ncbi:MAG: FAD-binding oxidoreductase [Lentilitoribacter sp.]